MTERPLPEDRARLQRHALAWRAAAARLEAERLESLQADRETRSFRMLEGWTSVLNESASRRPVNDQHGFVRWHARLAGRGMR
jgi:hypothetical protein